MTLAALVDPADSTSASGPMRSPPFGGAIVLGFMLAGSGTTAEAAAPSSPEIDFRRTDDQTTAGPSEPGSVEVGAAIAELRRRSGLTWDQLARIFDVSRRSLHFWASGKPSTPTNEEKLHRLVAVLRKIDRGSGSGTRAALVTPLRDGRSPLDLLAEGRFDDVVTLVGPGSPRTHVRRPRISEKARRERTPLPPHVLIDALQDSVHIDRGGGRPAKSVRYRGGSGRDA